MLLVRKLPGNDDQGDVIKIRTLAPARTRGMRRYRVRGLYMPPAIGEEKLDLAVGNAWDTPNSVL